MYCGELKPFFCYLKPHLLIERTNRSIRMFLGFFGPLSELIDVIVRRRGNFSSMAILWGHLNVAVSAI
jgi:hypothetical protein